jgi:hypothetical protein
MSEAMAAASVPAVATCHHLDWRRGEAGPPGCWSAVRMPLVVTGGSLNGHL